MGKPVSGSDSKSKAERRFEKKVQFYERVGETVATLNVQKTITKKKNLRRCKRDLKAFDLSTQSESLPGLKALKHKSCAAELKLNCKSRLKFLLNERHQMATVFNHPMFQVDPLRAIQLHFEATQPIEEPMKKKSNNTNGSKKRKEKKSKASSERALSMEMMTTICNKYQKMKLFE